MKTDDTTNKSQYLKTILDKLEDDEITLIKDIGKAEHDIGVYHEDLIRTEAFYREFQDQLKDLKEIKLQLNNLN